MKTNELIEKVKNLGLETEFNIEILIKNKAGRIICSINRSQCFQFDMDWYYTHLISGVIKEELFRIVCKYASTPIEERSIHQLRKDQWRTRKGNSRKRMLRK